VAGAAEDFMIGVGEVVPNWVAFLTAGVDVQARRLEIQIIGHGMNEKQEVHHRIVDYQVIELHEATHEPKMTTAPEYWDELEKVLTTHYTHESGVRMPIITMQVDAGYNADPVYEFSRRPGFGWPERSADELGIVINMPQTVVCTRGWDSETMSAVKGVTEREAARERSGPGHDIPIVTLGTGFLKKHLYGHLLGRTGYEHRRVHLSRFMSEAYFQGLVAERWVQSANNTSHWEKVYARKRTAGHVGVCDGRLLSHARRQGHTGRMGRFAPQFRAAGDRRLHPAAARRRAAAAPQQVLRRGLHNIGVENCSTLFRKVAYTQSDLEKVEQQLLKAQSTTLGTRSVTQRSVKDLLTLRDRITAELSAAAGDGRRPVVILQNDGRC
jgi:hypothetical protein